MKQQSESASLRKEFSRFEDVPLVALGMLIKDKQKQKRIIREMIRRGIRLE